MFTLGRICILLFAALGPAGFAAAQSVTEPALGLELNRVDQIEGACRLTFIAENRLGQDVQALTLETVLIDPDGIVERLTLFEFGALPSELPRVRQFDVPGLACTSLDRVLVNGVSDCGGIENCETRLDLTSRTDIEIIG